MRNHGVLDLIFGRLQVKMRERGDFKYIVIGGALLSFNAGFINALFVVSVLGTAIAHVTGTVSKASVALGTAKLEECGEVFRMWFCVAQ